MIEKRAHLAHTQPDDIAALRRLAAEKKKEFAVLQNEVNDNVELVVNIARDAKAGLALLTSHPSQSDIAVTSGVLDVLGQVVDDATQQGGTASAVNTFTNRIQTALPALVSQHLPNHTAQTLQNSVSVALTISELAADPKLRRATPLLAQLARARTHKNSAQMMLLDGFLDVLTGSSFDPKRFLAGSLLAASRFMTARLENLEIDA